jgi:hypothetical protein
MSIYTPLSVLTTEELIKQVLDNEEPTWLELELMNRIELLQEEIEDLSDVPSKVLA